MDSGLYSDKSTMGGGKYFSFAFSFARMHLLYWDFQAGVFCFLLRNMISNIYKYLLLPVNTRIDEMAKEKLTSVIIERRKSISTSHF